eukprot:scaffold2318_cov160-Pinguiococcus_pyrenoidosus.AAC.2
MDVREKSLLCPASDRCDFLIVQFLDTVTNAERPPIAMLALMDTSSDYRAVKHLSLSLNVNERRSRLRLRTGRHCFGLEGKQDKIALQKTAEGKVIVGAKLSAKDLEEEENDETRKPLDLVVVLDTSGSMSGQKLEMCKETCKFLLSELKADDHFAVVEFNTMVEFNTVVQTVIQLGRADDAFKRPLSATGSTNLSGGLFKGISMVMNPEEQQRGPDVSVPEGLGTNVAREEDLVFVEPDLHGGVARRFLHGAAGAKHGVSNPQQLSQMTTDLLSGTSISLFTFGYGFRHTADLLRALAERELLLRADHGPRAGGLCRLPRRAAHGGGPERQPADPAARTLHRRALPEPAVSRRGNKTRVKMQEKTTRRAVSKEEAEKTRRRPREFVLLNRDDLRKLYGPTLCQCIDCLPDTKW